MKILFFALLVTLCCTVSFGDEEIKLEDGVLVLTAKNFDKALESNKYILVEFYAPWCGHCKALAPEYAKAAKQLAEDNSDIALGKVDATEESELAERYEVRGYPTLTFFREGKEISYNGGRTADEIVLWLNKKTGPPAQTLSSAEEAEKLAEDAEVAVVGLFKDPESSNAKVFLDVANSNDEFPFAISSDSAVFQHFNIDKDEAILLVKKFDEKRNDYDGKFDETEINNFIADNSLPLVIEFTQTSAQKIFSGSIKNHLLAFLGKSDADFTAKRDILQAVAKDFKNKVLFVTIDTDEEDNERILDFFGIQKTELPAVRFIQPDDEMTKYKPQKPDFTEEYIRSFVQGVLDKKIKPHLLSEEIPDDWDKHPVKVLVSKIFDDVAFNKDKDVLVEFYAPWCGHCKQLVPIYDELGEKFKDQDDIIIAKMDSTANELEHTKIKSFPTIKLFKKGTNEVVEYGGERTLAGLTKFVETGGEFGQAPPEEEEEEDESHDDEEKPSKDEL